MHIIEKQNNLLDMSVGSIVAKDFRTAEVFKRNDIDFCCGGKFTLHDICYQKSIREEKLLDELSSAMNETEQDFQYDQWPLDFLLHHILNHHHQYVRKSIPILNDLSEKVWKVHGSVHPELGEMRALFVQLAYELSNHMRKEEEILFPFIDKLYEASCEGDILNKPFFGSVQNPISLMEEEHDEAGDILRRMAELSSDFQVPENACTSYRVYFLKLREFRDDLHTHIHLENNILFPKAEQLEEFCMMH